MRSTATVFTLLLLVGIPAPAQEVESTYLEIIFDASGSMEKETERTYSRELKVRIARDEIKSFLSGLKQRQGLHIAFRAFGMDVEQRCTDTKLLRAFGPVNDELLQAVESITPAPFGKTPIARSLDQALEDFRATPEGTRHKAILLITDGVETCDGDVDQSISAIAQTGVNLKVHIVGFDVLDWEDPAQQQLQAAARATGGKTLYPKNREELEKDLETIAKEEIPGAAAEPPPAPEPKGGLLALLRENLILVIIGGFALTLVVVFGVLRFGGSS